MAYDLLNLKRIWPSKPTIQPNDRIPGYGLYVLSEARGSAHQNINDCYATMYLTQNKLYN